MTKIIVAWENRQVSRKTERTIKTYMSIVDYAAAIRSDLKKSFPAFKFSVTVHSNSISIALMSAPKSPLIDDVIHTDDFGYAEINQYYISQDRHLSSFGVGLFTKANEIVKQYHWDDSRIEIDYFSCAFYYSLRVGKWDKPFMLTKAGAK